MKDNSPKTSIALKSDSQPQFVFIYGSHAMQRDPNLTKEVDGKSVLYSLHQYVVPDLPNLDSEGRDLLARFKFRDEQNPNEKYFTFYQITNQEIQAMFTGKIKDQIASILNTACLPEKRRSGIMTELLYQFAINQTAKEKFTTICPSLSTEININDSPEIRKLFTDQSPKEIEEQVTNCLKNINHHLKELQNKQDFQSSLPSAENKIDHTVNYFLSPTQLFSDQEKFALEISLINLIKQSRLWQKVNFKLLFSTFEKITKTPNFTFEVGLQSKNINLLTPTEITPEITKKIAEQLAKSASPRGLGSKSKPSREI